MEVPFTPEQEARLTEIASTHGSQPEELVRRAALQLIDEDARFRAAVQDGIAEADRGELIDEDVMDTRLEQILRS